MIIVKTSNGDVFVNENHMRVVTHDRENHIVKLTEASGHIGLFAEKFNTIEHVESVNYINEQTGTEWKDNGSQVEYLQRQHNNTNAELHFCYEMNTKLEQNLRDIACEVLNIVQYHGDKLPEDICKRLRNRGEEMKSVANGVDWMYRRQLIDAHKKSDATEADATDKLHKRIEEQAAEIRELNDEISRLKANARMYQVTHDSDEKEPSWWQRLWR